ncbi:FAD-dependent oxidoreductase [Longivirga aurantiaca]|uniref:FAD-dependent oxidoreductase n=1 Tax=Longivirga aurantiaca TaxID=1837743 RepID=A0ABW1T2B2_9ACTN
MTPLREPEIDVVVVGAGLAGLAAARHLAAHGRTCVVLEASDGVGGRMRSDVVDGVTVDRGFQLLNPAYPEAERVLDLDALALRPFTAGVLLAGADGQRPVVADPRRTPSALASTVRSTPGSRLQQLRFAAYAAGVGYLPASRIKDGVDTTIGETLRPFGEITERVLAPFLSGVLFDDSRTTSRRFVELVLRSFVRGTPSVPSAGMGAIPVQLAQGVDVRLSTPVRSVTATSVTLEDGSVIAARAVVVATDAGAAGALLPGLEVPRMNAGTTWWHLTDVPDSALTQGIPVLVVDPDRRGPVVNTVAVSSAAPAYSRDGRALVASTALGLEVDEADVRRHLGLLHGVEVSRWDTVAVHRIAACVPAMPPGTPLTREPTYDGVYVAGDHRDTASIQGALVSGRRIATALLRSG